jgi:LCP family protein required for cell wall assembly
MQKKITVLIILATILSACTLPGLQPIQPTTVEAASHYVTADPNSPATATPFMPHALTATATLAATPTFTPSPTPTQTPEPYKPSAWNDGLEYPKDQIRILVLGSDWRPSSGYRTDVIMLVSINPKQGTASIVSFPRDLYVTIPGRGQERINTAMAYGGFEMMADTFELNFGIRPDKYIMTNFNGFVSIVDSLGGITVSTAQYLSDKCDLSWRSYDGYCGVGPGDVYMDGQTALWYVRSRYSTSDFDRLRRAQEVIKAISKKLLSLDAVTRVPELYNMYKSSVEMNLGLDDFISLMTVAPKLNETGNIRNYTLSQVEAVPYIVPSSGASVLLPYYPGIYQILREAVYTP